MNFPFFISKRYLIAKKSHSAINIISIISMTGVAIGAMALVVVLSVFNGFDTVIKSLFNSFDPDIKITINEGKTFIPDSLQVSKLMHIKGVKAIAGVLEENALVKYLDKEYVVIIKGVPDNFSQVSAVDQKISEGKFVLRNGVTPFAVVGQGVAYMLSINVDLGDQLEIFVPKRNAEISLNPDEAVNHKYITPSGVFSIEQDFDARYVLVPLEFARKILEYDKEVTALEVKLDNLSDNEKDKVQKEIVKSMGKSFSVKNRLQQQEIFYKIMKTEKWAIFFILSFILIVASLNIIGSLTMLIIDKKKDIATLNNLGADWKAIRRIFLFEGLYVSLFGAISGIILGLIICWLQIQFGFVKLQGSGTFVIENYPVKIVASDILLVLITVIFIGLITSLIPVRVLSKKYFE